MSHHFLIHSFTTQVNAQGLINTLRCCSPSLRWTRDSSRLLGHRFARNRAWPIYRRCWDGHFRRGITGRSRQLYLFSLQSTNFAEIQPVPLTIICPTPTLAPLRWPLASPTPCSGRFAYDKIFYSSLKYFKNRFRAEPTSTSF